MAVEVRLSAARDTGAKACTLDHQNWIMEGRCQFLQEKAQALREQEIIPQTGGFYFSVSTSCILPRLGNAQQATAPAPEGLHAETQSREFSVALVTMEPMWKKTAKGLQGRMFPLTES